MILFYTPGTCALSEMIVMQWTGEPHRLCRVDRDQRRGAAYRGAVNPMGQVPALLVDNRVLTENGALLLMLADRSPAAGLAPLPRTPERYETYRWLSWFDSTFHVAHKPLFAPQRFVRDESLHDGVRTQALTQIRGVLAHLDQHLRHRTHVLGSRPSILDGYAFALARWCESRMDYAQEFPAVLRLLDTMRADPGVQQALRLEQGDGKDPPSGPYCGHLPFAEVLGPDGSLRRDLDA